jgi:hypothetical protein
MAYVVVLDGKQFKQFLSLIERDIRDAVEGWRKIYIEYHVLRHIDRWWEMVVGKHDGMIFKYNNRWIEIMPDGSGDYRTLVEFLEDEFGSLVNWLRERVLSGYFVKVKGEE